MHDQVEIVKLRAGRLKEVSRKTSRGVVENGRKLCQGDGCRLIERSGRAATQDHLLNRVLREFFFWPAREANCLALRSRRHGQQIREQRAVVPTEVAIGARLVLPGVPPVRSSADDRRGRVSHCEFHSRRLSQVSAKITFSQEP